MAVSEYFTPTHVYFGKGAEDLVGTTLKEHGYQKVLLHYGSGSVVRSGLLDKIKAELEKENISYVELGGVVPNPRVTLVREGIALGKKEKIDFILAVGGGSVLDSAKAIGYGLYNTEGDIWDYYLGKFKPQGCLPIGTVLTLSATGSEMSNSSVISNEEGIGYKRGLNTDYGRPKFAFLNPELTYSVSRYQTASGSADIMMHTLERYFHQGETLDLTDDLCLTVLKCVIKWLPVALKEPENYEARANLMWAGSISHNGLNHLGNANGGDWACHQMEHELSAKYDVAHGAGLTAVWSSWARFVMDAAPAKFEKLGAVLFGTKTADEAIDAMEAFFLSVDMPVTLKGLGIEASDDDVKALALNTTFGDKRTIGNVKVLKKEDIYQIFSMANR